MITITYELNTNYDFPHLNIYNGLVDGVVKIYKLTPDNGYVFYNNTLNDTELDLETGEEKPVVYYKTVAYMPKNYDFDNFPYVAVMEHATYDA